MQLVHHLRDLSLESFERLSVRHNDIFIYESQQPTVPATVVGGQRDTTR